MSENKCIFCRTEVKQNSIEHIIPESLGNKYYLLPNGSICRKCNNIFSDFEDKALSKTMLGFERARLGIPTKRGKAAMATSGQFKWTGNKDFKKNIVTIEGLTEESISNFNEKDGSFQITISDFDKSEMATAKLLLKIGFESIFKSQKRNIFDQYSFEELRQYLTKNNNNDWPFLSTTNLKLSTFKSIPTFADKHALNKIRCRLLVSEINKELIIFSFEYNVVSYMINLINRNTGWMKPYLENSDLIHIYPKHLKDRAIK
jgi:hypothetical protein